MLASCAKGMRMPWNFRPNRSGRSTYREFTIRLARLFWRYESPWPDYNAITQEHLSRDVYAGLRIDYTAGLDLLRTWITKFEAEWAPLRQDDGIHYCTAPESNLSFPEYDAFILHCIVRAARPKRIIELGSGMSTRVIVEALSHQSQPCEVLCVDRYPSAATRNSLSRLGVRFLDTDIVDLDLSIFDALEAGDIVFIDSSHVLKNFGDVELEYMAVLPRLKPGVLVHVHDIFLPHNYPLNWIVDWRCVLTEQQLLGAYLHDNSRIRVLSANHFNLQNELCVPESMERGSGGSFWFEILE